MKGATLLVALERLGIVASFSRPRVTDDNPYSEALFRTVKYRPEYPPAQRHAGVHIEILSSRTKVHEEANRNNPNRWSSQVRDLESGEKFVLNPTTRSPRSHEHRQSA